MSYADLNSSHGDGYTVEDLDLSSAMFSYGLTTGYYEVHFGGDNCDEPFIWVPKEDVKKFKDEDWDELGIPVAFRNVGVNQHDRLLSFDCSR
jgi:hypothetical protein